MQNPNVIDFAGFIQLFIVPGAVRANLERLQHALQDLQPPRRSLIILPELWGTGFCYQELDNLHDDITRLDLELQNLAVRYGILLAGSLPERIPENNGYYYNTMKIIGENGCYGKYRKQHLFPGEEQAFSEGTRTPLPLQTPFGAFGCMVCYDIRFPEIARAQCQQGADMLLCVSAWPEKRIGHMRALAIARAIENQTYLVACNGTGKNGEFDLGGNSLIVSPDGTVLCEAGKSPSAACTPVQWSLKEEAQRQFKSFVISPFHFSNTEKIASADSCVDDAERRSRAGQRVILIYLELGGSLVEDIDTLEGARRLGDHLIVAAKISNPCRQESADAVTDLLVVYAALGCVGAVFPLSSMTPSMAQRFEQCCSLILPAVKGDIIKNS
ncbi:MAG: hypothetical protein OEL83_12435 [Desulforhopalus sp.]|nr:hypothetical protein [Desulforhopalus sp.]